MELEIKLAYDQMQDISELFTEYTNMLIEGDDSIKEYLKIQNYDEELTHLEKKYGFPYGRLYIAYYNGEPAGCIGLRKIDNENCEMKRLYVRPVFRGKHIAKQLINKIINDSRDIGYKYILLDTLPFLQNAINLYKQFGFYETECYNDSPMETSIYMKKDL